MFDTRKYRTYQKPKKREIILIKIFRFRRDNNSDKNNVSLGTAVMEFPYSFETANIFPEIVL